MPLYRANDLAGGMVAVSEAQRQRSTLTAGKDPTAGGGVSPLPPSQRGTTLMDTLAHAAQPAAECVLARLPIGTLTPARKALMNAAYQGGRSDAENNAAALESLLNSIPKASRSSFDRARAEWKAKYPAAPPADLYLNKLGTGAHFILLLRPQTDFDPRLLARPPITPDDPRSPVFDAALRLFFPDYVIDPMGNFLHSASPKIDHGKLVQAGTGSMTIDGPFPYWEKFVTEKMVDFAVQFLKTDGFGDPSVARHFNLSDTLWQGAGAGLQAGKGGVMAAAAAATVSVIVNVFSSLFGGDPEPPAWLTKLLQMKALRGDTSPKGAPSFRSVRPGGSMAARSCPIAWVNPKGSYDLFTGYDEVMKRMGGAGAASKKKIWWVLGLAAAGAAAAFGG